MGDTDNTVTVNGQKIPWNIPAPKTAGAFMGGLGAAVIVCVAGKYGITVDPMAANLIVAAVAGLVSYLAPHAQVTTTTKGQ